ADNIVVGDMSGTDLQLVNIDLAATPGTATGDGAADTVTINGTSGDDVIFLTMENGALVVNGLGTKIVIENFEALNDTIKILGLGGDDVIDASALGANAPKLILDGGDGNDVIIGSAGNDTLLGRDGDDVLIGGPGLDVLDGGLGDNILLDGIPFAP